MLNRLSGPVLIVVLFMAAPVTIPARGSGPGAKPEEVGLSSERLKRIGELIESQIDARMLAGAVTLVARSGRIAHLEAHGVMDVESRTPMQTDAIFRIMSMTKPIVAVSILIMMEEGRVRLTDPLSKFIPELRGLKVAVLDGRRNTTSIGDAAPSTRPVQTVPATRELTIRDLLTHTSGLVAGGTGSVGPGPGDTLAQALPRLASVPLDFQPGTRWAYSARYGFDALARVIEVVSGTPYDQFAKQRIFDSLGMKDTFFYPAARNPRVVTLYQRADGALRRQPNPPIMNGVYLSGGGGLFSTAQDYLQFAQMLLNGGQLNGKRLVSPRSVELMSSAFVPDTVPGRMPGEAFGLGVRVVTDPAARNTFLSKGSFGWNGAYNTHFWIDPKERLIGILMTQTANLEIGREIRDDFENAVMQAVVEPAPVAGTL